MANIAIDSAQDVGSVTGKLAARLARTGRSAALRYRHFRRDRLLSKMTFDRGAHAAADLGLAPRRSWLTALLGPQR